MLTVGRTYVLGIRHFKPFCAVLRREDLSGVTSRYDFVRHGVKGQDTVPIHSDDNGTTFYRQIGRTCKLQVEIREDYRQDAALLR